MNYENVQSPYLGEPKCNNDCECCNDPCAPCPCPAPDCVPPPGTVCTTQENSTTVCQPACEPKEYPVRVKVIEKVCNPYGGFGEGFRYPPHCNHYPDVFIRNRRRIAPAPTPEGIKNLCDPNYVPCGQPEICCQPTPDVAVPCDQPMPVPCDQPMPVPCGQLLPPPPPQLDNCNNHTRRSHSFWSFRRWF